MLARQLFLQIRGMCKVPKLCCNAREANLFSRAMGKYLFLTNTISSGVLMGLGDVIQQEIEFRRQLLKKRYDWGRMTRMLIVGLAMGPLHHYFYKYLDKYLPKRNLHSIITKIVLDQLLMSPVDIACFFYGLGLLEGTSINDCTLEFNDKFVEVYLMDWCLWPPTQFINFYFLPVKYQVLYINLVTMIYNVFLSYIKHKDSSQDTSNQRSQ